MKMLRFFWIFLAVLSLQLSGCGDKHGPDLPPPSYKPGDETDPSGEDDPPGGGGEEGGPTNPWDANRGKIVTPSGAGWTIRKVREGITYYYYSGRDEILNQLQHVHAVDIDLSNPGYAVKLTYDNTALATSEAHTKYNSIATINAGYEAGSIYIRSCAVNGTFLEKGQDKSSLPNTSIGTTGVRNWKSEAGFFGDGERGLSIKKAEELIRPYMSPELDEMSTYIRKQRNFYLADKTSKDVLSSSPMLIDDFNPVGETFINYSITNWESVESTVEPQYHQRKEHPRTAIALTENNHFIMLVVDGRQKSKGMYGMSAKALTRFLVTNFNPQYALNLDGGGSTSMCVSGLPDGDYVDQARFLVDSPIQDNEPGKERPRDTHLIIIEK